MIFQLVAVVLFLICSLYDSFEKGVSSNLWKLFSIINHYCPTVEDMIISNYMNNKHLKAKLTFIDLN